MVAMKKSVAAMKSKKVMVKGGLEREKHFLGGHGWRNGDLTRKWMEKW